MKGIEKSDERVEAIACCACVIAASRGKHEKHVMEVE